MSNRALTEGAGAMLEALRRQAAAPVEEPTAKRSRPDDQATSITVEPTITIDPTPVSSVEVEDSPAPLTSPTTVVEYKNTVPPTHSSTTVVGEVESFVSTVLLTVPTVVEEKLPIPTYNVTEMAKLQTIDTFNSAKCKNNYLKTVKWSTNGKHLAVTSQDRRLRIFDVDTEDQLSLTQTIVHGDLIYDTCWTEMDGINVVATSSRCAPIHVWSPVTGKAIATYRGINHLDELAAAFAIDFSVDRQRLIGAYKKHIRIFDVSRPGRHTYQIDCTSKTGVTHAGMMSCLAASPHDLHVFAVGSYDGSIGLYNSDRSSMVTGVQSVHDAHDGGITQIMFAPNDAFKLYSAARMDAFIHSWDTRMPGTAIASLARPVNTNQRAYFDLSPCGEHMFAGGANGELFYWNVPAMIDGRRVDDFDAVQPRLLAQDAACVLPCVSINPTRPLLATGSGQRTFPIACHQSVLSDDDAESSDEGEEGVEEKGRYVRRSHDFDNVVRIYKL